MKTNSKAVFRGIHTFENKSTVANIDILAGKDQNGKPRYLKGGFAISEHTKGVDDAIKAKGDSDSILVEVDIKNLYGIANGDYVNYRGLLDKITVAKKSD